MEEGLPIFRDLFQDFFLTIFITLLSPLTQWVTSFVITPGYFNTVIQRSVELGYYPSEEEAKAYFNFKNYIKGSMIFSFFFWNDNNGSFNVISEK